MTVSCTSRAPPRTTAATTRSCRRVARKAVQGTLDAHRSLKRIGSNPGQQHASKSAHVRMGVLGFVYEAPGLAHASVTTAPCTWSLVVRLYGLYRPVCVWHGTRCILPYGGAQ
eukprot:885134-Prymnesium_polylepis.1